MSHTHRTKLDYWRDKVAEIISNFALHHIATKWYEDQITDLIRRGVKDKYGRQTHEGEVRNRYETYSSADQASRRGH